jgi:hypothetical protein
MPGDAHPSSSAVQREAEVSIVAAASATLSVDLVQDRDITSIAIGTDSHVEVDGATRDRSVVVEAYARQGKLRGAQLKKIAQDVLKLATIKDEMGRDETRAVIAFADEDARRSIGGWVRQAADRFGVELITVEISAELREKILAAQRRQVMINGAELAGDVAVEE